MSTATVASAALSATDVLREQMRVIHRILNLNAEGITQEDSLIQPQPGGNCFNWNVGHLVDTNEVLLELVGQPPLLGHAALRRYARGSEPLRDAAEAMPFSRLMQAWNEGCACIDAGLAAMAPERLSAPAPHSPRKNPNETVGSLLSIVIFHQASHTGQTSLLRRMAGKEGAVK